MKNVPYYSNTKDGTRCYQAVLKMILKYSLPDKKYTWKELDILTDKKEGKWTWPMMGLINMKKMGFDVIDYDDFDYEEFSKLGLEYLSGKYGKDVAKEQDLHSDIKKEILVARRYLEAGIHIKKPATLEDIKNLLKGGYLTCCNVNQAIMNNKSGYIGHFVLVYKIDSEKVYFHDPGLPAIPDRRMSEKVFYKAWAYPDETSCSLQAFRYIRT